MLLATDNSVAKISNRFTTNYIYIYYFLIIVTCLAIENSLLKKLSVADEKNNYLNFNIKLKFYRPLINFYIIKSRPFIFIG